MQHLLSVNSKSNLNRLGIVVVIAIAMIGGTLGMSASTLAADCKGQSQAQCGSLQSCSWVDTYKRKDGRTVNGFCRTKGKPNKPKPAKPTKAGS